MTGVVGALVEAWGEVRVHRSRVVLSLVGVVLAVFAMTIITAGGALAKQVVVESAERSGGRTTTLQVSAFPTDGLDASARATAAYAGLVARYGVTWSSTVLQTQLSPDATDGSGEYTQVVVVDPAYGTLHRLDPVAGRWLTAGDGERLSPAVVVNTRLLETRGMAGRRPPFALELGGSRPTVTVVGVVARDHYSPEVLLLTAAAGRFPELSQQGSTPSLELWVPPEQADHVIASIQTVLRQQGLDGSAFATGDAGLPGLISKAQWAIRGLSLFALGLGALGVLNVGIVTVRQRIREIGVRRALGASSGRVFAAVVLESVCATALAGAVGVAAAVALVVNLPLDRLLQEADITDVPGFPVSAAVEAFVAAVAVGALAGLVPATIAVRSKVIDAIRY